ncbi:MAG: DUF4351 domain-containing protein, partial [Chloroflexaceae bacterium]|nr:DUF4351 domain-containing protein [Chloroflexaceae bacterium]
KDYEESQKMPYVTYAQRYGRQEGLKEGLQQGLQQAQEQARAEQRDLVLRMVAKRFGPLDEEITARVAALPHEYLDDLALALLDFNAPPELVAWLDGLHE